MAKVVYNACGGGYSGYSLSNEACAMLRARGYNYNNYEMCYKIPRHNKDLVEVVETLGAKANNAYSRLAVEELKEGTVMYRIEEYDGQEEVVSVQSTGWIILD